MTEPLTQEYLGIVKKRVWRLFDPQAPWEGRGHHTRVDGVWGFPEKDIYPLLEWEVPALLDEIERLQEANKTEHAAGRREGLEEAIKALERDAEFVGLNNLQINIIRALAGKEPTG